MTVGAFLYIKYGMVSREKEFSLIKPWYEPGGAGEKFSQGFLWVHRQCHENLVDTDAEGQLRGRDKPHRLTPMENQNCPYRQME
jgi:hypothetical protein